jgi:AbrB family looped-hinge helix DNA binding protein
MAIDLTKLSQKGQVVIPNTVRKKLRLKEGMKFLVVGVGDTIVLRRLMLSEERTRLKQLLEASRRKAEKAGFTAKEIEELIHQTRKVS